MTNQQPRRRGKLSLYDEAEQTWVSYPFIDVVQTRDGDPADWDRVLTAARIVADCKPSEIWSARDLLRYELENTQPASDGGSDADQPG